jgi:hypothetical protein
VSKILLEKTFIVFRKRRLAIIAQGSDGFGIATSVIGADGKEKNLKKMDSFDPTETKVCLTASRINGQPTTDVWEIINLTDEDHNLHIQTRFSLLSKGASQPARIDGVAVLQDNVPVPHARLLRLQSW